MKKSHDKNNPLLPSLGLFTTSAIVIGAAIGSGIFKKPALMASQLGSPELMLIIWVVAGIITLFGALSNAEVAGMITKTGGQYVYFDKMYGKFIAFLYGWSIFAVIQSGSIASITYVFAEYFEYFYILPRFSAEIEQSVYIHIPYIGKIFPLADIGVKSLTILIISILSAINYRGVKFGGQISAFFTTMKVAAILILILLAFSFSNGSFNHLVREAPNFSYATGIFGAVVAAMSGAFWSYDGWNNITYIAGEVKQPQNTIPKALMLGTLVIIGVYLLINIAFLYVLPIEVMAQSKLVAADVATASIGAVGGAFVAAAVMISTFGTSNGTIMASSRVYFAMARNKMFFSPMGHSHDKHKTPHKSLVIQASWASILVLSGTFDILTDMLIFVSWIFYAIGAYGLFVLRKKYPDAERPYKVWGYPYVPIIFIVFATIFVIVTLYNDIVNYHAGNSQIINSLFGLLLVAIGIPFFVYFNTKRKKYQEIENK